MQARFYIALPKNGYVRLKLNPEQEISFTSGGRTEEGSYYRSDEFSHQGDHISWRFSSTSIDCDGRMDHSGEFTCSIKELQSRECYELEEMRFHQQEGIRTSSFGLKQELKAVLLPNWTEVSHSQRDYAAEAMGF